MTPAELVVTILGAAAIVWELWYFLGPRQASPTAPAPGVQEVPVTVRGGYIPDTIVVRAGTPVRLQFYRDETADCSARVVFDAFGIDRELPAFETTAVEFTPERPGEYYFRCGEDVLRGVVVVEPADAPRRAASSPHRFHG
ncbi:MAG TPA: cupredoxin domain-containing protein [Gemmatimonadales bacterium]|nr:cupredoxin domain-containing protein [Gemmatimonadales bacterium]